MLARSEFRFAFRSLLCGALLATTALASGCKDEGVNTLFDEDGTWELVSVALSGSGLNSIDPNTREEAFLLKFTADQNVVQTAMCADNENEDPTNSLCRLTVDSTQWFCGCYAYAFVENEMAWRQFTPGGPIPEVSIDDVGGAGGDAGGGSGGGESGGSGESGDPGGDEPAPAGDVTLVTTTEVNDVASTFDFTPLPPGVFGSDGLSSKYIFQQKASSLFGQVFEDPDGRTPCEPCVSE